MDVDGNDLLNSVLLRGVTPLTCKGHPFLPASVVSKGHFDDLRVPLNKTMLISNWSQFATAKCTANRSQNNTRLSSAWS